MRFTLEIEPLDLDLTLGCGQVFRWSRTGRGDWIGPIGRHLVTLGWENGRLSVSAQPGETRMPARVSEFLRASDDIMEIQSTLSGDSVLSSGLERFRGLRIVKMDEWECLASYVLATYANIPRIAKMIDEVSMRFGHEIVDGVRSFPSPSDLREASVGELQKCGLGYRAKYLHSISRCIDRAEIRRLKLLEYRDLRRELMTLPGVGEKVADCVSLFGFGKLDAFPIDVWIERAISRLFNLEGSYKTIRGFATQRWGDFAGYAQEYLYFNERALAKSSGCEFSRCAQDQG
ncbi:MAG: hypothetical protein KKE24_02705 [Candidatus Thermoplasmatota archaeon]|nr:hypothetical protein [Candidatus Thermoplasmatota archaeon]